MGRFSFLGEAFVETFQQNHDQTYSPKTSLVNKEKDEKATTSPLFCVKGHKYEGGECQTCESGKYQDIQTPHRKTECIAQPELSGTDCKDGEYFFISASQKQNIYDTTTDRQLTAEQFCKRHEDFNAGNCDPNTYLRSDEMGKLRQTTKDTQLTKTDYCAAQPSFDDITCGLPGMFENITLYNTIVQTRLKRATNDDICSLAELSNKVVSVLHTHFDEPANKKSFRTVKLTGRVNADGNVFLKPTAQRSLETGDTPSSRRSSSSVYAGDKMDTGHNRGRLDQTGWSSQHNTWGQWYQMDNGAPTVITGVAIKGRACCSQWVKTFKVLAFTPDEKWVWVDNQKVYQGNFDQETQVIVDFDNPIQARSVRIYPVSWSNHMSMRCEVRCANVRNIANATKTTVPVRKDSVFNLTRTEAATGLYSFDIEFEDSRKRISKVGSIDGAYLYDFQFSLTTYAQHVRKGSDNYRHPGSIGENIQSVTPTGFDKNSDRVQKITYTAKDIRSEHTLTRTYNATVYTTAASIKAHANQNTKHGEDHHAPQFNLTNMHIKYIGGMPGKNSIHGDAHTFTGHYQAIDNFDHGYIINLHPKVTKYKFAWASFKDVRLRRHTGYHWHGHFASRGINCDITHAQYNWHPHHNIDINWIKTHVHDRHLRFHARNRYNHGEGKWFNVWVRVYDATASIKLHANQNTKYGEDHHAPQFNLTNMHIKYIGGMPGKHSIHNNAHTFTGHYQAIDNFDHGYRINLHPKVTKYKFAWPVVKHVGILVGKDYHWHHQFSSWGVNCSITHAQYNWHPHHNIDNNWIKNNVHNRPLRFHARNNYNHGEGKWLYANANIVALPKIKIKWKAVSKPKFKVKKMKKWR